MAEVDSKSDPDEANLPPTHTEDSDDEYFKVEDIRSCNLGPRVLYVASGVLCICSKHILLSWDGPVTRQVERLWGAQQI